MTPYPRSNLDLSGFEILPGATDIGDGTAGPGRAAVRIGASLIVGSRDNLGALGRALAAEFTTGIPDRGEQPPNPATAPPATDGQPAGRGQRDTTGGRVTDAPIAAYLHTIADLTGRLFTPEQPLTPVQQLELAETLIAQYEPLLRRLLDRPAGPVITFHDGAEGLFAQMLAALHGVNARISTPMQTVDVRVVDTGESTLRYQHLDEHDDPSGPQLAMLLSQIERVQTY
jgi:hypothetical protein